MVCRVVRFFTVISSFGGVFLFAGMPLHAQDKTLSYLVRDVKGKLQIDGSLDEGDWATADSTDVFFKIFSADSLPAETRTIVRMLKSRDMLYVGVVLYGKRDTPLHYTVSSLKRDFPFFENDLFGIALNPSGDKLNGYLFNINPMGVQNEAQVAGGDQFDYTWDQRWYVETTRFNDKWVLEMGIPFSSIRFPQGRLQWRVNFIRVDNTINEYSGWVSQPRNRQPGDLTFTGLIRFETVPVVSGGRVNLFPTLTNSYTAIHDAGGQLPSTKFKVQPSLDAKIGLSSSLVADLTVNPDFSQAEVDASQANLTRFELNYPEKRPFFIENSSLTGGFGHNAYFGTFGGSPTNPFYSRRIGLAYNPVTGQYDEQPLIGGARVYGKITPSLQGEIMSVQTGSTTLYNADGSVVPVPTKNCTVAALQQNVFQRSSLGAIFVNVESARKDSQQAHYDRTYSLDFNLGTNNGNWKGKLFHSGNISGGAGKRPSFSSVNTAEGAEVQYTSRPFFFTAGTVYTGAGYNPEAGFVPRSGVITHYGEYDRFFYPHSKASRVDFYNPFIYYERENSPTWKKTDELISLIFFIRFKNTAELFWEVLDKNYTWLSAPFDPSMSGSKPLQTGQEFTYYNSRIDFTADKRQPFSYRIAVTWGQYFTGHRYSATGQLNYKAQPWGKFSVAYTYDKIDLPQGRNDIWVLGPRADISFNKSVFLTGLIQYNSLSRNMQFYTQLQWRFRPLSDLYLVYNDNYNANTFANRTRSVVLKLNYLINW